MEEILASIRRIIEPEDEMAGQDVFVPLAGASRDRDREALAPPAVAALDAPRFDAPSMGEIEAAARPWGSEANDPLPRIVREARLPVVGGTDRFASALQRLARRGERPAAAPAAAVAETIAQRASLRASQPNALREETSQAVAKLRAVADRMGRTPALAAALAEPEAEIAPMPAPLAPLATHSDLAAPAVPAAPLPAAAPEVAEIRPPVVAAPARPAPMSDFDIESQLVADLIAVIPPAPANDLVVSVPALVAAPALAAEPEDDGYDEEFLLGALRRELDPPPPAVVAEPETFELELLAEVEPNLDELGELIAAEAGRESAAAFGDLAAAIRSGTMGSLETITREMLRPMLREWMDDNLPLIVERMVQDEIQRVARGAMSA